MYDVFGYLKMMSDPIRTAAYAEAIAAVVRPGDTVLDLGAGAGLFAMLAVRAGARRVYAVDTGEIIDLARRMAEASGLTDRVVCFQDDIQRLDAPEPVDVVVSDLHGVLPLFHDNLAVIDYARRRWLRPRGALIPQSETMFVAPVDCPDGFASIDRWRRPMCGLDYSFVADRASSDWFGEPLAAEHLLAPGQPLAVIDYARLDTFDPRYRGRFDVARTGTCNGLGVWFISRLAPGVEISTAPDRPQTVYRQAYFPLTHGYDVTAGDAITVEWSASHLEGEYYFTWGVELERRGQAAAAERHSQLEGVLFSPERILKSAEFFAPSLSSDGEIERAILEMMDGRGSLRAIAERLAERFPARFSDWRDAMARVREASARFGR